MNITLSVPPNDVVEVREWGESIGISLNQYIRDCLKRKADEIRTERAAFADEFRLFAKTHSLKMKKGWRWNKAEAAEREVESSR